MSHKPGISIFILIFCLTMMVRAGDEGIKTGDPVKGKELFESDTGCNVCHGMDAKGSIGPNIRETITLEKVYHALQNFPDMMNWQYNNPELFEEESLVDIVAYLQSLTREPVPE